MSARHHLTRASVLALGSAAAAGATFAPLRRPARADDLPTLRIAYQPYQYAAQVLYAHDTGTFTQAGLAVELQSIAYGSAVATAVAAGAMDVGVATVTTLAQAHAKGLPFVIVAPGGVFTASRPATGYLYVGNQSGIMSAKDMNGKVVGTPGLATIGEYGVRWWVDKNGGDSSTLKFQEMPFSQMPAAFATGRIDAAFAGEPYMSEIGKVAHPLAREMDTIAPEFMVTCWFAMAPWAAAHADLVGRFASAMRAASVWAMKNPAKCVDILAREFKLDPATISPESLSVYPERTTPALLAPTIALTAKYGKFPAFPAEELIYTPPRG